LAVFLGSFYFFYFGIVGIYVIFFPKVLLMLHYTSSEIGLLLAASPLVRFLIPFAFTKGFQLNIMRFQFALLLMILSASSLYYTIDSFYPLLVSNIGLGIGMSLVLPYIEVIALNIIKKEHYGKIRLFGSIGFILVALVLVKYLSSAYVAINYLVGFVVVTSIFALGITHKEKHTKKEQLSNASISLTKDWKLWLSLILMQVSFGAFYNFFTIYETQKGITLDTTIHLWVFGVVVEIVMLYFQTKLLKYDLVMLLQVTIFATIIRWLLLFFAPTNLALLYFSQSLHALSFALFYSVAISYLHQRYENKVLAQQFFSGLTFGLGGLVGAVSFGYIYEYNKDTIFLVASLIALGSLLFITLFKKSR